MGQTDRETMYKALSHLGWGYVFLYFDLNLGPISLTPAWAGYLLFSRAIGLLREEHRDLALLAPLADLLGLWAGAKWGGVFLGLDVGNLPFLPLIAGAAGLYFHFQLFTDLSDIAAKYQDEGEALDRRFLRWRTVQTLLLTVTTLWAYLPWEKVRSYGTVAIVPADLATMVCLTACVFALRRHFKPGEAPPQAETPDRETAPPAPGTAP